MPIKIKAIVQSMSTSSHIPKSNKNYITKTTN
ncbi:hypothetical protein P256_00953 [Acinetobacter nectaris CIP 110549]|uniref:Uncharacterized protein n=1 Tax=Acinetobacter nectaris CIP 110549 TaxID=1392540 RepID=V2TXG7_9GAMM|nr:hypothetical protein P256_00953 [Acinetobacter nectaris CIP 110549]